MGILQNIFHAVHPPCAHCPYHLGLIRFVQSPCPACIMYGYRMYDELTRGRRHILGLERTGERRDGADDGFRKQG